MKNLKNCLYEKDEKCWVEYDEQSYELMKNWRLNFCAQQRYDKACFCPRKKQWMCNTICVTCPYRKTEVRLSKPIAGTEDLTLEDKLADEIDIEMQCAESAAARGILLRLDELLPKGQEIVRLRWEGYSWDEISKKVGLSRRTIMRKLPNACEILTQEFGELKNFSTIFKN